MIKYLEIPKICPYCNTELIIKQENNSKILFCPNEQCESRLTNRIEHFFSKKGLNIKGISKATIEKLIDWGWVNNVSDVFKLYEHETEWKNKAGFGEKSVNNIITSIREGSNCDLESVISAAGIPLIGRTVARQIASVFDTYQDFREAIIGDFDFSELDGFGYEMNKSLKNYNYNELDYIVKEFLTVKENKKENNKQKLKDLTFVITGKLIKWKNRDKLISYIESLGGKVTGSVTKNTNYLINNDIESNSAKNNKAKELGIPILNEEYFIKKFDL